MHGYRVSSALAAVVAFGTFLVAASSEAGQYEGAPTFSATQAIQGVPLHGADYSIGDRVPVENFQYVFDVNTKWGPFRVKGSDLLRVRLREVTATEKLARAGLRKSVRMERARELEVRLLQHREVEIEPARSAEHCKGVHHAVLSRLPFGQGRGVS